MPVWARLAHWSKSRTATSSAGVARKSRTSCGRDSHSRSMSRSTKCESFGRRGPAPTAATTPTIAPSTLQYWRDQGTGWDPKGPASMHTARAALDTDGKVIAYEFNSKAFSRVDVDTN